MSFIARVLSEGLRHHRTHVSTSIQEQASSSLGLSLSLTAPRHILILTYG